MIRAIVFDCFGTLVGTSYFTFRNICPPERLKELADTRTAADYGYLTRAEYARRIGDIVGMDEKRVRDAIDQQHVRNEALIAYAKLLKRTYKTALLSNVGSEVMDRIFDEKEMKELFDIKVLSCEVGIVKPDRQIYMLAAKKLGLAPEECLMVDDREEFCAGADAAGMIPVLHQSNHQTMRTIDHLLAQPTD